MIKNRLKLKIIYTAIFVSFLNIKLDVMSYNSYEETKEREKEQKLQLGKTSSNLPNGLSLEFGTDLAIQNQIEGEIQRIDRKNKALVIKDEVYNCDRDVVYSANQQKSIRFRNLKKGMQLRIDFEIDEKGLSARKIHLKDKLRKNMQKDNKKKDGRKPNQYNSNPDNYSY